jgi:hypothetical protein
MDVDDNEIGFDGREICDCVVGGFAVSNHHSPGGGNRSVKPIAHDG